MNVEQKIILNKYIPRVYQVPIIEALELHGYRKILAVLPRRCLAEDTPILMHDKTVKMIKDLLIGDKILSFNGEEVVADTVQNKWATGDKEVFDLRTKYCPQVTTTADHRFYSRRGLTKAMFRAASELKKTDALYVYDRKKDRIVECDHIRKSNKRISKTYDIETKDNHNFFANGYLVHNSGKDITAINLALRQALMRRCTIAYIFPTQDQARESMWSAIDIQGNKILDYYIPPEIVLKKNETKMEITLLNESRIKFIGSNKFDRIRGTNPYGVIMSEASTQDPRVYPTIRPILSANGGWVFVESCVAPSTLVITGSGMRRISDISTSRKEYTTLNKPVYGLNGFHNASDFYYGGKHSTLKIKLSSGFEIECTKIHKLWNGTKWIKSSRLKLGDTLPVQYGQEVFGPGLNIDDFKYDKVGYRNRRLNLFPIPVKSNDFFYLLGLIHGDGSYGKAKVTITNKNDAPIQQFLRKYGFNTYGTDEIHFSYTSKVFCSFLEYLGFKHGAKNKTLPSKVLDFNKEQLKAFIQGLFDSDGSSNKKRGSVHFASACEQFVKDLQVILLNFGLVAYSSHTHTKPSKVVSVESDIYKLELSGYFAYQFYEKIGFRLKRKQFNKKYISPKVMHESGNIYNIDVSKLSFKPAKNILTNPKRISRRLIRILAVKYNDKYLFSLLKEKFFYSGIKSITTAKSEVFDFVIPETHSFFSNGLISHNTPFGKNHFWDLYQVANNAKDWFCYYLTLDDTKHIPMSEIDALRASGEMSEEMIKQEFYCSWSEGVEGTVYGRIINQMKLNNQITHVPYERDFPVHTAWDMGYTDATAIIFFQLIGQSVHIIDYYENNKLTTAEYIDIIKGKPYSYGKHLVPFDSNNNNTEGQTRVRIASQLGVIFTLAKERKVSRWEGIEAVRAKLPAFWIDKENCSKLIKAFENYRKVFSQRKMDFDREPLHDWASHGCDAARVLVTSMSLCREEESDEDFDREHRRLMYRGY